MTREQNISDIVRSYSSRLKEFIRKRVQLREDAEDILQDVFYQLAEADLLLKPIEHISAWLYQVARNRIIDLYRKKKPEPMSDFLFDHQENDLVSDFEDMLYDAEDTPETEYLQSTFWAELEKALRELPPEQQEVFELNELRGIPFKEIAEATGETVNTLISRKRYAVLHLRDRLQVLYNELLNF